MMQGGGQSVSTPTNLKATAKSSTSIRLTWGLVEGTQVYNIESNNGHGWSTEGSSSTNAYTASELQPYTNYSFRVRAVGHSNVSEWSSIATARTHMGAPTVWTKKSGTTVTLSITPVDGVTSYAVYYGTTSDINSAQYLTNTYPENGSIPDVKKNGLTAGKTYYFFVKPFSSSALYSDYATVSVTL